MKRDLWLVSVVLAVAILLMSMAASAVGYPTLARLLVMPMLTAVGMALGLLLARP